MAVLLANTHGDILTVPQNPHHQQQHIFKVDSAPVSFNLFISLQQSRDSFRLQPSHLLTAQLSGLFQIVLRGSHSDLGPLHLSSQVTHRVFINLQAQCPRRHAHQRGLMLLDRRAHSPNGVRPKIGQLPQRGGVKSTRLYPRHPQISQPRAHLPRRAGSEGQRQHLTGLVHPLGHPVSDAVSNGAGFTRAGARQHA